MMWKFLWTEILMSFAFKREAIIEVLNSVCGLVCTR